MAKALTQTIQTQISDARVSKEHTFTVNSTDYTSYLTGWNVSHSKAFGSSSARFTINNNSGLFGEGGANQIYVGDIIELVEQYGGDSTQFKRFYGRVEQRAITKAAGNRIIQLTCLDYISTLKQWDINLVKEGTKVEITNETLTPNYLASPNEMFAQVFDFANDAIADQPRPILTFRDKNTLVVDPQYDGFEVYYPEGQVKLGAPLNALDNYDLVAKTYYFYTQGVYFEDILESIFKEVDGYGKYLFGETSAEAVVDNHLKTSFQDEDGEGVRDTLTPNLTTSTITIRQQLSAAVTAGDSSITVASIDGLPAGGEATINGDTFTWIGITESTKTLTGIPTTGSYALKSHSASSYVEYEADYAAGRVWYMTYSNITSDLSVGYRGVTGLTFAKTFSNNDLDADYSIGSPTATFTRSACSATYFDAAGVMHTASAANFPRFTKGFYDTTGFHSRVGLLIEGAATNRSVNSMNFTPWSNNALTLTSDDAISPDGTTNADRCTVTASSGYSRFYASAPGITQNPMTFSIWVKNGTVSQQISLRVQSVAGSQDDYTNFTLGDGWCRYSISVTPDAANILVFLYFHPDEDSGTPISGEYCWAWGAQTEQNRYATSLIPTIGTALTRNAETLKYVIAGNRTADREACVATVTPGFADQVFYYNQITDTDTKRRVLQFPSTNQNDIHIRANHSDSPNSNVEDVVNEAWTANTEMTLGYNVQSGVTPYVAGFYNGVADGTNDSTDDFTVNAWGTYFWVGCENNSNQQLDGIIQSIAFFNRVLTPAEHATVATSIDTNFDGDFSIPSGANAKYFDARFGRIILDGPLNVSSVVKCNSNYEFKTLQASGIELNKIAFRPREVENAYAAIEKLKKYIAPNYIVRTQGDDKIWSSYLSQRATADYTLNLVQSINYLEDEDLYTRVIMYGKNKNPSNIMFDESVSFITTGESYKALATQTTLTYDEDDTTAEGWHVFKTTISDAGYIHVDDYIPLLYINGVPVDNQIHQMTMLPVKVELKTRTESTTKSGDKGDDPETTTKNFYYYKIHFAHQSIEPNQTILLYNPNGINTFSISPNDSNMDYGRGIYYAPGDQQNSILSILSTSTYWVLYSTNSIDIDYDNVKFRINNTILPAPAEVEVTATFEYITVFTAANGTANLIDGRWDTQVQTEFFSEPPTGYNYAIIDLGQARKVQAVDIIGGYYKPDEDGQRKFDIDVRFTLHYSTDNENYYEISDETHNVQITSGEAVSFEEKELGTDLEARYIKVILENVKKIEYNEDGVYPVAFTELSVYTDIVLKSEAKLIATTTLGATASPGDGTVTVVSTDGFTEPGSGATETAYIGKSSSAPFTYTGLTTTTFTGCVLGSGVTGSTGDYVTQTITTDTTEYDNDALLPKLGDRVYKKKDVSEEILYLQAELDDLAKDYLQEFYKNHSKLQVNVLYSPYLKVGQTVAVTDTYNNISAERYFIDSVNDKNGFYTLVLAKYPA